MMGTGVFCAVLARYNLRELFDLRRPVRLLLLVGFVFIGALGGFRSAMIQFMLVAACLFCLEGLYKTRARPVVIAGMVVMGALLAAFAIHLPRSVQRTLAFLPIEVDPGVKMDAQFSNEWRLRMWEEVLPDVPHYLLLGKGYAFNPTDVDFARINARAQASFEGSELVGDYHNGPLSVIVPFGLAGVFFFGWFMVSAGRVFYRNYKFGDPELEKVNTFLFAFYLAKLLFFLTIFGSLYVDLATFAGAVGLSISLNGGVAGQRETAPEPVRAINRFRLAPGLRRPVSA